MMTFTSLAQTQRARLHAPCGIPYRMSTPIVIGRSRRTKAIHLEPIDSNEHSIRFKVLEEVPLVTVVEHILVDAKQVEQPDGADLPADSGGQPLPPPGRARALELLQLGAVYVGVPQKGLDHITWVRSVELPVAVTAASVPQGHYIRVHPRPKRYPACHQTDWPRHVLFQDEDLVVVNKPAGLPCMRHESNAVEELASCVGRAMGLEGLEVCHRLDQWTTGVVVLSRTKEANKVFKRSLQDREAGLVKTYKALTYTPVPLGPLEHHMYDGPFNEGASVLGGGNLPPRGPRLLSRTAHQRWRLCRLEVLECREHTGALDWYRRHFAGGSLDGARDIATAPADPRDARQQSHQQTHQQQQPQHRRVDEQHEGSDCGASTVGTSEAQAPTAAAVPPGAPSAPSAPSSRPQASLTRAGDAGSADTLPALSDGFRLYESTIALYTGRTHQIRAQLASLGCPLVGDTMYAPLAGYLVGESGVVEDPARVSLIERLPMLERHVGLHAWRLTWRGHTFVAPTEWGDE